MELVIVWLCLGGGMIMMLLAFVLIRRLQSRTQSPDESEADLD